MDYSFLMMYAVNKGVYYVQVIKLPRLKVKCVMSAPLASLNGIKNRMTFQTGSQNTPLSAIGR